MSYLQKIGKSLMLPVAVLPVCGILMGLGYLFCPASMQGAEITGTAARIGYYLTAAAGAVINNMAILFVIGVSLGMSDDGNGAACLSGLVSWLVITTLLSPEVIGILFPNAVRSETAILAFEKIKTPFIGILSGLTGAECYNRFRKTVFPDTLAFFSGRRFVAIVSIGASLVISLVLLFVWPLFFGALVYLGEKITGLGYFGAGLYAFFNRLLIPSGLHHALNNVFWFDTIGIGDLVNFWAGRISADVTWDLGIYMSGFFPCMMFGIPGTALAIYRTARDRKKARGILLSSALCAVVCGLSEPFEFLFMFSAFPLYVVYSVLYAVITWITCLSGFRAGFSFSAGAADLLFSASLPAAARTWMIIPLGALAFGLFYIAAKITILKLDLKTPGREDDVEERAERGSVKDAGAEGGRYAGDGKSRGSVSDKAAAVLEAIGGRENIVSLDCCATRLRLELKKTSAIDQAAVRAAGAAGVNIISDTSAQIVIGTTVQQLCDAIREQLGSAEETAGTATEEPAGRKEISPGSGRRPEVHRGDLISLLDGEIKAEK